MARKDYEFITCAICGIEPASSTKEQRIRSGEFYMVVAAAICNSCANGRSQEKEAAMWTVWENAMANG